MQKKSSIALLGKSNVGRVRTNNEDAFVAQALWDKTAYLAVAIDGVGGYEGGEVAAAIAQKAIPDYLSASANGERVELLKQAVTAANNAIAEAREADPAHSQMSCVLTAALIDVEQMQISMAHVGDSRLYRYHKGELKKLSHDHSLIGYREEIGDLTEEEAMHHPQRNVIGRDVGSQKHKANDDDFIEAEVFPMMPNTTLLLCSDGLTDMITSATIAAILGRQGSLENKVDALIKAALDAGGKDNVTVVLFDYQCDECEPDEPDPKMGRVVVNEPENVPEVKWVQAPKPPKRKIGSIVVVCLLVGLLVGALAASFYQRYKMAQLKKELEERQNKCADSIQILQGEIDSLKYRDFSQQDQEQDVSLPQL